MSAAEKADIHDGAWAVRLSPGAPLATVALLRTEPGVEVHAADGGLWLRGGAADARLRRLLAAVPAAARFWVDRDGACRPPGALIPAAQLPEGPWRPLREWATVLLPPAALPAGPPTPVTLRLCRSDRELPTNALLLPFAALAAWALSALEVRLRGLAFALRTDGSALVVAAEATPAQPTPVLPPLPGAPMVVRAGIALPAGFRFAPDVPPAIVAQRLHLPAGDLLLFAVTTDGTAVHERIAAAHLAALTRAAIRATLAAEQGRG